MSMCVINVVNNTYQKYIPMFLFFCVTSYPEYSHRILLTGKLNDKYKKIISVLKNMADIEVISNYFQKEYVGHELKVLRWLIKQDDFLNWDNLYIGDIDIIICKEEKSLETQHLNHSIKNKIPYSNSVRPNSKRLSGLHFICRNLYYKQMNDVLEKYRKMHKNRMLKNCKNEMILYKMIEESGLKFPDGWNRPHHGLHLGLWRGKKNRKITEKAWSVIGKEDYRQHYNFFKNIENDKLYKQIYKVEPLSEITYMKENLDLEFGIML